MNEENNEVSYRNKANYSDHLGEFPTFRPLSEVALRERINHLSDIELSTAPSPRRAGYPDLVAVQLIAYHRIVKFRRLLDSALGNSISLWRSHRNPGWCGSFLDYQLAPARFVENVGDSQ
jgi:hypothetical protein